MNDSLKRKLIALETLSSMKNSGMLNPMMASMLVSAHASKDPKQLAEFQQKAELMSNMFKRAFSIPGNEVDAPIRLALTERGQPVGFYPHECHWLLSGQTGCGKSTLLRIINAQAMAYNKLQGIATGEKIICWIFSKAPDMRSLLAVDEDIIITSFREIKMNPLQPPHGVSTIEWTNIFVDFFISTFQQTFASKAFLCEHLMKLYANYSSTGYFPSLLDLYESIRDLHFMGVSRQARYQEGIINRLHGLLSSALGPVFECSHGHIESLVEQHVVFEVMFLTAEQNSFMTNYLMSYLFHHKMANEIQDRHFLTIDDANSIFQKSLEYNNQGLPTVHEHLCTVRKTNITVFAATQTPHQIGASIHSNAFGKITFALSNGQDVEYMLRSMGIKKAEQKEALYRLMPREAVIKFSSRYVEPFLVTIPEVQI